jgi:hypothetical protein
MQTPKNISPALKVVCVAPVYTGTDQPVGEFVVLDSNTRKWRGERFVRRTRMRSGRTRQSKPNKKMARKRLIEKSEERIRSIKTESK